MKMPNKALWLLGAAGLVVIVIVIAVASNKKTTSNNKTSSTSQTVKNNVYQQKKVQAPGQQLTYLTDAKGRTLYTSNADKPGVSNCDATCLKTWPAYAPSASEALPSNLTVIKRSDGSSQYAYKGQPLYYFVSDTTPGDVTGNGLNGFYAATP